MCDYWSSNTLIAEPSSLAAGMSVRTHAELIFKVAPSQLQACPKAAALFSTACYMTGQSVLHEELNKHAHECYEQVSCICTLPAVVAWFFLLLPASLM